MDTFAAPAFATDPASRYLLGRMPGARGTRLFSAGMIKMILGHLIYQVAIALILHFLGHSILGLDHSTQNDKVVVTLVFAWIFNSVNCRRLDNKLNISEGILNNQYFVVVTLIEIGGQILILFVGSAAFQVKPIPAREWGISLALGFVSIPRGALIRCVPTPPLERAFITLRILTSEDALLVTKPDAIEWDDSIIKVQDNLSLYTKLCGGRANASPLVLKSRRARVPKKERAALFSLMTCLRSSPLLSVLD